MNGPIIRGDRTPLFDLLWQMYLKYGSVSEAPEVIDVSPVIDLGPSPQSSEAA